MIDTHVHLCDKRFKRDQADVIARAREAGVTHLIEIAYAPGVVPRAFELANAHAHIFLCVGVHPSESGRVPDDYLPALREHARHPRVVAIGETGLDFYRDHAPRAKIFLHQLMREAHRLGVFQKIRAGGVIEPLLAI